MNTEETMASHFITRDRDLEPPVTYSSEENIISHSFCQIRYVSSVMSNICINIRIVQTVGFKLTLFLCNLVALNKEASRLTSFKMS